MSLSVGMSAPLLALGVLPCLSELSPHSYHFHLGWILCCLHPVQDGGVEVLLQPSGCFHKGLLEPIRSVGCFHLWASATSELRICGFIYSKSPPLGFLSCGFSPFIWSQLFSHFLEFLVVSGPWRIHLIWQYSCGFLFFLIFCCCFYWPEVGERSYSLSSLSSWFNFLHSFLIPWNHASCLFICLYVSKTQFS